MKTPFSTTIPVELLQRLEKHCKETGESKTEVATNAISDYLDMKEGRGNG